MATHPGSDAVPRSRLDRLVVGCYGFRAFALKLVVRDVTGAIRVGLPVVERQCLHPGPGHGQQASRRPRRCVLPAPRHRSPPSGVGAAMQAGLPSGAYHSNDAW